MTSSMYLADAVLLTVGGISLFVVMTMLTVRRHWAEAARLPAVPANRLEVVDLLIGVAALMFLPGVFKSILDVLSGAMPTTQPAADALPTPSAVVSTVLGQIAAAAVMLVPGRLRFAGGWTGWGIRAARWPRLLLAAVAAFVVIWPLCAGLLDLTISGIHLVNPTYELPEHNAIRLLQAANEPRWLYGLTIGSALILAPIVEELFFRGLLLPAIAGWLASPWQAVVLSGCAFGLLHVSVPHTIPALAFLGVALGYCYAKTGSLTLVIFIHAVFNGKTLLWLMLG